MTQGPRTHRAIGAGIVGTGMAVPRLAWTNHDLEKKVETSDEWIIQRTGIRQRHVMDQDETLSDLGAQAVQQAMERAGLQPADLDLLICATMYPQMVCPATSCQIVEKIGAIPCGAMDLNLACSGFVAALNTAANYITAGAARNIAVVGAEQLSRLVNWKDRNTCVLFGDGAGAAIVQAADNPDQGCRYQKIGSDGRGARELYVPRCTEDVIESCYNGQLNTLQMNGREVFKFAVTTLQRSIEEALEATGLAMKDIALVIPHQSNARILSSAREKLNIPEEKMYVNLDRFGNTSAASVAICLNEVMQAGSIKPGDRVLFTALGGGLSWATSLWQF